MITKEYLDNTWDQLIEWPEERWLELLDKMGEKHPVILTYITEIGDEALNESEGELMLFLGVFIWYVLGQVEIEPLQAETFFEKTRVSNEPLWEYLTGESEDMMEEIVVSTIQDHQYKDFLEFLAEVIWDDDELEDDEIRPEKKVVIWLYLKILIESLQDMES